MRRRQKIAWLLGILGMIALLIGLILVNCATSEALDTYASPTMRAATQPSPDWLYPDPSGLGLLSPEAAEKWLPEALEYEPLLPSGYGELVEE